MWSPRGLEIFKAVSEVFTSTAGQANDEAILAKLIGRF